MKSKQQNNNNSFNIIKDIESINRLPTTVFIILLYKR